MIQVLALDVRPASIFIEILILSRGEKIAKLSTFSIPISKCFSPEIPIVWQAFHQDIYILVKA